MEKRKITNLTQHEASEDQKRAGVVDLPEVERKILQGLLTFESIPSRGHLVMRAAAVACVAKNEGADTYMIGGAPFFMGHLEKALKKQEIAAVYAFSKRVAVEKDGKKTSIFVHEGFVGKRHADSRDRGCGGETACCSFGQSQKI